MMVAIGLHTNLDAYRDANGNYEAYQWPGGYPLYAIMSDGADMCIACANENRHLDTGENDGWTVAGIDVNWEDTELTCENCYESIESAYGEDN